MSNPKIDRYLRAGILVLAGALVYVIYASIYERVIAAGDNAPEFSVQTDGGKTVKLPDSFTPNKQHHQVHMKNYAIFERLSVKLFDEFEAIADLQ